MTGHRRSAESRRWPGVAIAAATGSALALFSLPERVLGHSGPPPVPDTLWRTWNVEPVTLLALTIAVWAYVRGVRAVWKRAGVDRGVRYWQFAAGLGGFAALFVALISPLDPLSSALFSAHMVQHTLLIAVAPLLFVLANISSTTAWALPASWRRKIPGVWRDTSGLRGIWAAIARPLPALILHSIVLWAWHVPAFYNAAIRSELVHVLEHITMFASALLFWWVATQRGRQAGVNYGIGLLMVFGLVIQKTALGALITFSPSAWYSEYAASTAAWGLTPIEDQQLAGAVLMGPAGLIYLIAGVTLFAGWIRAIERNVNRDEQFASGGRGHAKESA